MAAPPADKTLRSAGALLLAFVLAGLAACGSGDRRVDDAGLPYSFAYPSDFRSGVKATVPVRGVNNQTAIAKESGQDFVSVQTLALRLDVNPERVPRFKRDIEQYARSFGRVRSRRGVRVGGLDGVVFDMSLRGEAGVPIRARWVYAAKDRTLFWIDCQWRTDRAAIVRACDKVVQTFRPR